MEEKALRRAGLDYHEAATVQTHASMDAFFEQHKPQNTHTQEYQGRVFACSTKGKKDYDQPQYQADDILLFGPETRGLPASLLKHRQTHEIIRIPMLEGSRSLNLSNAVAIIAFEAWRQNNFGRQ